MNEELDDRLDHAARSLENGGFQETLRILESTDVESLMSTDFWYLRGFAKRGLGQHSEAADAFDAVLAVKPDEVAAQALAADSWVRCGRLASAERLLLAGLARNPNSADLLEVYCFACARAGRTEKARALLERLEARDPTSFATFRLRALIEFVEGSDDGIYEAIHQSGDELPDTPESLLETSLALLDGGHLGSAARCLRAAVDREPNLLGRRGISALLDQLEHPLLAPNRLLDRFAPWMPWAVGACGVLALRSLSLDASLVFAAALLGSLLVVAAMPFAVLGRSRRQRR